MVITYKSSKLKIHKVFRNCSLCTRYLIHKTVMCMFYVAVVYFIFLIVMFILVVVVTIVIQHLYLRPENVPFTPMPNSVSTNSYFVVNYTKVLLQFR